MSVYLSGVLLPFDGYCRVLTMGLVRYKALREGLDSQPISCVLICFSSSEPFPVSMTVIFKRANA